MKAIILGLVAAALSSHAFARDIHVSASGNAAGTGTPLAPYASINKALAVALPGDTIYVAEGTYKEQVRTVRSGTAEAPISIVGVGAATLRPPKTDEGRLFSVYHDHIRLSGLTFTRGDILLFMFGVSGVVVENNLFDKAVGECVRLRYQSKNNVIRNNVVKSCGRKDFNVAAGAKNGEGIYIGTAPEQLANNAAEKVPANAPLGQPTADLDVTRDNLVIGNVITAPAECVDFKEGTTGNVASENICRGGKDPDGGALSSRGNGNAFIQNVVMGPIPGAGIRLGGDTAAFGLNNVVRDNVVRNVGGFVVKDMNPTQALICGNVAKGYAKLSRSGIDPLAPCGGRS